MFYINDYVNNFASHNGFTLQNPYSVVYYVLYIKCDKYDIMRLKKILMRALAKNYQINANYISRGNKRV